MKVGYERTSGGMGWPGLIHVRVIMVRGPVRPLAVPARLKEQRQSELPSRSPGSDHQVKVGHIAGGDRVYEMDWAITAGRPPVLTTTNVGKVSTDGSVQISATIARVQYLQHCGA